MNITLKANKTNARLAGVFFILAAVTSILGLALYGPILNPDNYLIEGAKHSHQIVSGAIFELLLACTAIGTGIVMYPFLRKYNESLGLGYVCFRILEVVFILIGTISVLSLLSLSNAYVTTNAPDESSFQTTGGLLMAIHSWTFMLGPNFMLGVNTLIYSYVFFRSGLVPRKLSILGLVAAVLILTAAILEMFGSISQLSLYGLLLALPIFAYEMTLAIWLIIKGFNGVKD